MPECPVKLEMSDYDHSNGYGEPPVKRANTTSTPVPNLPPVTTGVSATPNSTAPRTQRKPISLTDHSE